MPLEARARAQTACPGLLQAASENPKRAFEKTRGGGAVHAAGVFDNMETRDQDDRRRP